LICGAAHGRRTLARYGAGIPWKSEDSDLNAKNAAAFGKQLAPYLEHARRAGRAQPRRPGRAGRQRSGDIRAWAKEQGLAVSKRGRIPASVLEQYHAAAGGC
jgi:hypothetical protein